MQVKDEDISTLIELQHNDMELLRVQKAIADLPQRKTIVAARKKIKAIEEKQETVGKLRAKAEEKLAGISEEDGKLAFKQEEAQKAVDSASGYRDVEAHTREMDGYAKRRATLEEDLAAVDAELGLCHGYHSGVAFTYKGASDWIISQDMDHIGFISVA